MTLDTDVVNSIPSSIARMYNVLCVAADELSVTLATSNLIDPKVSDEVSFALTKEVRFVMAKEEDVSSRISQYYGDESSSVADMLAGIGEGLTADENVSADPNDVASLEGAANNNAVIRFVNLVLYQGVVDRASDIHI
jgi:type IV pilus assembly protein PilB